MTEQDRNKQIARDYFGRCWNQGGLEFGRGIIAEDYDFQIILPAGFPRGFVIQDRIPGRGDPRCARPSRPL